jgi:cytoskeletal protein RodZ
VKQIAKSALSVLIIVVAVGVLITAFIRSGTYTAPSNSQVTVSSVQKRLAKTSTPSISAKTTTKVSKQPTSQPASKSKNLTNTGPGDVIFLFILSSAIFTIFHILWRNVKQQNNIF